MSQPDMSEGLQVRGHSRYDLPAPASARAGAWLADLGLAWILILIAYRAFDWAPLPDWKFGVTAVLAIVAVALGGRLRRLRGSAGERMWAIRKGKTRPRESSDAVRGGFLTALVFAVSVALFSLQIASHPYWRSAEDELLIPALVPPSDWKVLAFYYTLAPWPTAVGGRPVFYSVPYEVGPPKRFIGKITADWVPQSVRLSLEGPKTPIQYQERVTSRSELRQCFEESPILHPGCVAIRRITLQRPLRELRARGYTKFSVSWFLAENPGIPDPQRAQGVLLRAFAGARTEDRYILVTPNGLHQALELSYLDNQEGRLAARDLRVVLGALRISEDLNPGRAWAANLLESVHLDHLPPLSSSNYVSALSEIQSSLISMASVSPSSFDAYYHLAGSSLLLLRYFSKNPEPGSSDLRALARAMVERMARYGRDVDPSSPRNGALDELAKEARQL